MLRFATCLFISAVFVAQGVSGDSLVMPCQIQDDCSSITGSVCNIPSGVCECSKGSLISSDLASCLQVAPDYGAPCVEHSQCAARLLTGGQCLEDGTCGCGKGFHYLHSYCWRSVGLNGSCSKAEQCFENYNYESLTCSAGKCVCSPGFYMRGETHCRRVGKAPGEECTFDMDCQFSDGKTGVCTSNTCRDGPGLKGVERGDPDGKTTDADALDAQVNYDAVTCTDGGSECDFLGEHGECNVNQQCWCARGFFVATVGDDLLCMPELGESCNADTDTGDHIEFATCREDDGGRLSCSVRYTPGKNNRECVILRKYEFNCQSEEMCLDFGPLGECRTDTKKCGCNDDSYFDEDLQMCWVSKGVHEDCVSNKDCLTISGGLGMDCRESTCQCIAGYHEAGGECRRDATVYGEECVEDDDCYLDNSRCSNKKCVCNYGFYAQNNTDATAIICIAGVGASCTEDSQCPLDKTRCGSVATVCKGVNGDVTSTTENPVEDCYNTTQCVCNSAQLVASADFSLCLAVANQYGAPCQETVQCSLAYGTDSECRSGKCVCEEDFHFRDKYCWPIKELGDRCTGTGQCYLTANSERAECRNGICQCLYDYVQDEVANECTSGASDSIRTGFLVAICLAVLTTILNR